jgi:hypothetical protein
LLYFAIPIIADVGGSAFAALSGSLRLLRIVWTDALVLRVAAIVFLMGVGLVAIPLLLLVGVNIGKPSGGLVEIFVIVVTAVFGTFSAAYTARLYLFARSIELADEPPETAAP